MFSNDGKRLQTYRSPEIASTLLLDRQVISDQAPDIQDTETRLVELGLLRLKIAQQQVDVWLEPKELNTQSGPRSDVSSCQRRIFPREGT